MITALIISNMCLILILKGVPTWLWAILSIGYVGCNVVALILWEETTDKIKRLENKMKITSTTRTPSQQEAIPDGKKYLTPSEVRKMTPKEVKEKYDLIVQSMKYWK